MATTINGTTDTGPVQPTPAHNGWGRIMMESATFKATGRAAVAGGWNTTIAGTANAAANGISIASMTGTIMTADSPSMKSRRAGY